MNYHMQQGASANASTSAATGIGVSLAKAVELILATAWATVRLFFILSVLLCSVNKAGLKTETWLLYCLRLRSRSPHNAKHSTS